jgi:hypothetical protein
MVFHAVQLRRLWRVFQDLDEAGAIWGDDPNGFWMLETATIKFDIVCTYFVNLWYQTKSH